MRPLFAFTLLVGILSGCTRPTVESPVETTLTRKLDQYIQENLDRQKIPGFTIAITRNDSVIYTRAFGYTNVDTKQPMKPENVFHWASVSKTFVATAIMQLVEQGKINLDEKLVTYLPYFRQQDPYYKNITIRQMLNHTSGIGDVDDYEWDKPQYDSLALERFVKSIANDKMVFAPGTDLKYSNTAYETLGDVIAKVSGMSFETYVRKNIFDPLEMKTSSFLYQEIPDSLKVSGHRWAIKTVVSKHYPYNRMHGPSSTLNSNVIEMTHYARAHLNRGVYKGKRILADSTYDLWWRNSVNMKDKPDIGFAWWLDERNGVKLVGHSGGDTGFRSYLMLAPEKNISIVLVSNYEVIRTYEFMAAVFDTMMGVEPIPVKRTVGFDFAELLNEKGMDSAKAFLNKAYEDTVTRKYYSWKEDDGAFAYPAYLLMDQQMYPEAIELFKFNLERFPQSSWANYHLAGSYVKTGALDLARHHYLKAIELDPEEPDFKEELKKLDSR